MGGGDRSAAVPAALERLLAEIQIETRLCREQTGVAAIAPAVLEALRATPREAFVPASEASCAYLNEPLPIGFRQTISQPFIVALMTQLLRPESSHTILEIGSGSGYQAAVLARLVARVVSVEIIPELAAAAAKRLQALAVDNVDIHCADGRLGWPAQAPYDGIIVTACASAVPPALTRQLKSGGRMLIPVGEAYGYQELRLIEKAADATLSTCAVLPVAFVPLTHPPAPA
jgi:protein-L-isoaspartate(D-aspartate) O-methyltransferase